MFLFEHHALLKHHAFRSHCFSPSLELHPQHYDDFDGVLVVVVLSET